MSDDDRPNTLGEDRIYNELQTLANRLRRLEDVAFEGDGLTRSVTRLGMSANALGEALLTVDRNQQKLTKLGEQLDHVEKKSATKEDVEKDKARIARELASYRKTVVGKAYAYGLGAVALLLTMGIGAANYVKQLDRTEYRQCMIAVANREAQVEYYSKVLEFGTNEPVKAAARQIIAGLDDIDCGSAP